MWGSEPLLGFKAANLHGGGSHVGCLLASVRTTGLAEATFPETNGKVAFPIDPDGTGLIGRTHIGEPSERREPRLERGKA
jgi:hypothetical protein